MTELLGLVFVGSGILGFILLGIHLGARLERSRPIRSRAEFEAMRDRGRIAFETGLRRSLALPRMHSDPDNAPRVTVARIKRK